MTILIVTHAIHGQVLSQRPGVLKSDIPIPLSRPRTEDMLTDPRYLSLVKQVRSYIDRPNVSPTTVT